MRNPFTLKARQRKGGAHTDDETRSAKRRAALKDMNELPEWREKCSRCGEVHTVRPARNGCTELQLTFGICPSCDDRKAVR